LILLILSFWILRHLGTVIASFNDKDPDFFHLVYFISFLTFTAVIILSYLDKPYIERRKTDRDNIVVIVPVYNEDVRIVRKCLKSILTQTRKPDKIYVVDDGSNAANYSYNREWLKKQAEIYGVKTVFKRQKNTGKRGAQALAVRDTPEATIYVTVDSDSMLDEKAIAEGKKPFIKPKIQAVAGLVMNLNVKKTFISRLTDLMYVTGQLVDRSSMSFLSSVLVNSGGLAFYRANIVRDNLDVYLNEKFMNMDVKISDDSMLTLFALQEGRTVQQSTAITFNMMPEKFNHHVRQLIRWQRGSFIRSFWRIKYLPVFSFGFLRQVMSWINQSVTAIVLILIVLSQVILINSDIVLTFILVSIATNYIQTFRYLTIRRTDESFAYRVATFIFYTPIISFWSFFIFRPIKLYASLTCLKSGWGTRKEVEVRL
jgi:hyaluronan synthase